jgi:hypothetical protein
MAVSNIVRGYIDVGGGGTTPGSSFIAPTKIPMQFIGAFDITITCVFSKINGFVTVAIPNFQQTIMSNETLFGTIPSQFQPKYANVGTNEAMKLVLINNGGAGSLILGTCNIFWRGPEYGAAIKFESNSYQSTSNWIIGNSGGLPFPIVLTYYAD